MRSVFTLLILSIGALAVPDRQILGHGAYHDVVAALNEEIALDPENVELRFRLATAHVEHGEWEPALTELAEVRRLSPDRGDLGYLSGKALSGTGKLDEALVALDDFLVKVPGHQQSLAERARVHLRLGRNDAAITDYQAALTDPAPAELHVEAIEALRRLGRGAEAHQFAEMAVKASRRDPGVLVCAVDCAVDVGEVDAALVHLDHLITVWPRPETWMLYKARLLGESGRREDCLTAWRELHGHLLALPNLERAQPFVVGILGACREALGIAAPAVVVAPPAP